MSLILPKRSLWQQPRTPAARADRSNPLARGIDALWLPGRPGMVTVGAAMTLVANRSGRAVTSGNTANNRIEVPTAVAGSAGDFTIVFHGLVPAAPFMLANFSNTANPSPPNYNPTSGYLWWTEGLYGNPNGFICGMSLNNGVDYPEQNFQLTRPTGPCTAAFSFVNNAVLRFALDGYAEERAYTITRQAENCNSISIGSTNQDINGQGQYNATLVYNRALSLAELRAITRNPWQVFAGKRPAFASLLALEPAAGGAGIVAGLDAGTAPLGTAAASNAITAAAADTGSTGTASSASIVVAGTLEQLLDDVLASTACTSAIAANALVATDQAGSAAGSTEIAAHLNHGLDAVLGSLYGTAAITAAASGGVACDGSAAGIVAIAADASQAVMQAGELSAAAVAIRQADLDGSIAIAVAADASAAISAGMAQLLDAVLGSLAGTSAIAGAVAGDATATSAADAGSAIAAGTTGSISTGGELSGSAVSVRQADASQILDPVAAALGAGVAISASLSTGIDAVLASLGSHAAISSASESDFAADTAVEVSSAIAGVMDAVTVMRTALDGAVAIAGNNATPTEVESSATAYQRPAEGLLLPAARTYRATLPDRTYFIASASRRYRAALPLQRYRRAA